MSPISFAADHSCLLEAKDWNAPPELLISLIVSKEGESELVFGSTFMVYLRDGGFSKVGWYPALSSVRLTIADSGLDAVAKPLGFDRSSVMISDRSPGRRLSR